MVNAELNWWGKPDGPDGGLMDDGTLSNGQGVKVIGNIDVEPWLGVNAEASASTLAAETGEVILFSSAGTWAYTFGECCQTAEELPIEYLWEFDDGSYSMEENPAHVFDAPGTYNVILEIYSSDSRLWGELMFDWAYLTIEVTTPGPLTANADGEDLGGYEAIVNEDIQLYGIATGGTKPYTYYWDLGDGTNSNEQNPVHIYTSEGKYIAILTVTDSVGATASDTAEVLVLGSGEIVVLIDAESNGIVGNNMAFNSIVYGGTEPYTYEWDFGDGTPINNEANPLHIFENKGTYTVTLTVTDSNSKTDDASTIVEIKGKTGSAEIEQVSGGLGIKATIAAGDTTCDWTMNVNGLVFIGGEANGNIQANVKETVKIPLTFAFGKVDITVTADEIQKDYKAFAIGPFFLSVKEA
jgi:PKD repeat protein